MEKNEEKVTVELSHKKPLIFFPAGMQEARDLQKALFKAGFRWAKAKDDLAAVEISHVQACVEKHLVVENGEIYTAPKGIHFLNGVLCRTEQVMDDYVHIMGELTTGSAPATEQSDEEKTDDNATSASDGKGKGLENENVLKEARKAIDEMIGLEHAKKEIRQNVAVARVNQAKEEMGMESQPLSRNMVLTGNPGTGKTTFIREVAKVYFALGLLDRPEVVEVKREDLVGTHIGKTEAQVKEILEKSKGGLLFIDEAYSLTSEDAESRDFGQKAVDVLITALENERTERVVAVAGYPEKMKRFIDSNPGLKSRFTTYIPFDDYTIDELAKILDLMLKKAGCKMTREAREGALKLLEDEKVNAAKRDEERGCDPSFGNGRTVRNLVELAMKAQALRLDESGILEPGHKGMKVRAFKAALRTIELEDVQEVSLEDITTPEDSTKVKVGFASSKQHVPGTAS